jgi:hypothetical protein
LQKIELWILELTVSFRIFQKLFCFAAVKIKPPLPRTMPPGRLKAPAGFTIFNFYVRDKNFTKVFVSMAVLKLG